LGGGGKRAKRGIEIRRKILDEGGGSLPGKFTTETVDGAKSQLRRLITKTKKRGGVQGKSYQRRVRMG